MVNLILASPQLQQIDWYCVHLPKVQMEEKLHIRTFVSSEVNIAPKSKPNHTVHAFYFNRYNLQRFTFSSILSYLVIYMTVFNTYVNRKVTSKEKGNEGDKQEFGFFRNK